MKFENSIISVNVFLLALFFDIGFGLALYRTQNESILQVESNGYGKRDVGLPLAVCVKGYSTDASGKTMCNGDSSGVQRPATELDCIFPFQYNGIWHENCIQLDKPFLWCSIDMVYSSRYASCDQQCPLLTRLIMRKQPNQVHSTCLTPNQASKPLYPSDSEIRVILDSHNSIRSKVTNPTSANMRQLTWDLSLARVALRWAQNCVFQHDCDACRILPNQRSIPIGQNAFASSGVAYDSNYWSTVVNAWGKEIQYFKYGSGSSTGNWENIGHYTQIVRANSGKVGCAASECGGSIYAYCNYDGAQENINTPYVAGNPCSQCGQNSCQNGICTCTKFCKNNSKLDLATCTCKCPPYATGSECEILLCDKSDKDYGCWGTDPNLCSYSNVNPLCPKMCGMCSYN